MPEEKTPQLLVEGIDFTIDGADFASPPPGRYVFTAAYLRQRGECCGSKCRNCPYEWKNVPPTKAEGNPSQVEGNPSRVEGNPSRRIAGEKVPPLDRPR